MQFGYLAGILVGIVGMAIIDWRYQLAFWGERRRTVKTVAASFVVFVVWDICAIIAGIFKHGTSAYQLPFTLLPHFPLEEIFFLVLLVYTTLVIYRGVSKWRSRI